MQNSIALADPRAENALLACLLNERMAITTAMTLGLSRKDFAYEVNALVFDAMTRLLGRGEMVDAVTLMGDMAANNTLDMIGGESVIRQIADSPFDQHLLGQYVNIIRDRSMRRRLSDGFERSTRLLYSQPEGKVLLEEVQNTLYRTLDEYMASSYMGVRGSDLAAAWESRHEAGPLLDYSWRTPQAVLGGRKRGDLSIWGLYTSDGKSTIALRNAVEAVRGGSKVMFVLLEMTDEQMTARLLSYMTGISMQRLELDDLTFEERALVETAFEEIAAWGERFMMYFDPTMTVSDIRAIQMRERYDLVVIDYLQRFDFADYKEIPRFAKQLKNVALTTKCHIDVFSQITPKGLDNRSQNPFPKPDVNMLYGGKATAHEADNVIFLWAHREQDRDGGWHRTGYGTLHFEKVRQGRPGLHVDMVFQQSRIQWEECTSESERVG